MYSSRFCMNVLLVAFMILTALNVSLIGGFIGKAEVLYPDVDKLKERQPARIMIATNALLCILLVSFLLVYLFYRGFPVASSYTCPSI